RVHLGAPGVREDPRGRLRGEVAEVDAGLAGAKARVQQARLTGRPDVGGGEPGKPEPVGVREARVGPRFAGAAASSEVELASAADGQPLVSGDTRGVDGPLLRPVERRRAD